MIQTFLITAGVISSRCWDVDDELTSCLGQLSLLIFLIQFNRKFGNRQPQLGCGQLRYGHFAPKNLRVKKRAKFQNTDLSAKHVLHISSTISSMAFETSALTISPTSLDLG